MRARQPDLVLPVAAVPRRGRPRAGGWSPSTSSAWASPSARSAPAPSRSGSTTSRPSPTRSASPGRSSRSGTTGAAPISLGWALAHRDQLRGVVLTNTAVHQPADAAAPSLIRLARTPALRRAVCAATPTSSAPPPRCPGPRLPADVRDALAAPYRHARPGGGRSATFVADIPLDAEHLSARDARRDRRGSAGARRRAGADAVGAPRPGLLRPLPARPARAAAARRRPPLRGGLAPGHRGRSATARSTPGAWLQTPRRRGPARRASGPRSGADAAAGLGRRWRRARATRPPAVVELAGGRRTISFDLLERRVRELAAGLAATGVRAGDRVALLVPPGADLTAAVYACWRAGRGHRRRRRRARPGRPGPGPARRGPRPRHRRRARARAGPRCWASRAVASSPAARAGRCAACSAPHRAGRPRPAPAAGSPRRRPSDPDAEAAVLFTSGATGPAKGVVYRHRQLQAQLDALRTAYGITADDRLVAAFAPFALYGPALGIASAVPAARRTAAPHRGRARRRRRRRRGHRRLRLARRAAQRRGDRRRARRRPIARRWPGSAWSSRRGRRCPRRCCTR